MLRCAELGLTTEDLEEMTVGMVYDLMTEKGNDSYDYPVKATQEDIYNFSVNKRIKTWQLQRLEA